VGIRVLRARGDCLVKETQLTRRVALGFHIMRAGVPRTVSSRSADELENRSSIEREGGEMP